MITISPGHFGIGTGAVDLIDEVEEATKVVHEVARLLVAKGVIVHKVVDKTSKNQRDNLRYLQQAHGKTSRVVDIFIHFNATAKRQIRGIGTEVLYKDNHMEKLATDVSKAVSEAAGFINRGAKKHEQLYVLNTSEVGGLLIEVCFVNSEQDVKMYKQHFHAICLAIANELQRFTKPKTAQQQFSSKALQKAFQQLSEDEKLKKLIVQQAIRDNIIQQQWLKKLKDGTMTNLDVNAVALLLLKKQLF